MNARKDGVTIQVGKLKTENTTLILKWQPVVITFSSGEETAGHNQLRERLVSLLEPLDVKILSEFHPTTTHFLKTKKNSSKVLYALVNLIPIVTEQYANAVQAAGDAMERDFFASFPDPNNFLPDPKYAVNPARKQCLKGQRFIFGETKQREALLPVICAAGAKCLQYDVTEVSTPQSIADFAKSHTPQGILVKYPVVKDDDPKELAKLVAMNEAAKALGVYLLDPIEFLTAIQDADGSKLYKPRKSSSGKDVDTSIGGAQKINSFLQSSIREPERPPQSSRPPQIVRPKPPKRMNLMAFFKKEPHPASASSSQEPKESPPVSCVPKVERIRHNPLFAQPPDHKRRKLDRDKTNEKSQIENSGSQVQVPETVDVNKRQTLSQSQSQLPSSRALSVPQLHIGNSETTIVPVDDEEDMQQNGDGGLEESDDVDVSQLRNLAIVENTLPVQRSQSSSTRDPSRWNGLPNFKGFKRSHTATAVQTITLIEIQNLSTRIENDVRTMFNGYARKRARQQSPQSESAADKRIRIEQEQVQNTLDHEGQGLFFGLDEDISNEALAPPLVPMSTVTHVNMTNDDEEHDDEDEFEFKFTT